LHFHWTDVNGGDVINEHIVNGRGQVSAAHSGLGTIKGII